VPLNETYNRRSGMLDTLQHKTEKGQNQQFSRGSTHKFLRWQIAISASPITNKGSFYSTFFERDSFEKYTSTV
jgi:hypothetical protein